MDNSRKLDAVALSIEAQQITLTTTRVPLARKCMNGFGAVILIAGIISLIIGSVMVSLSDVYLTDFTVSGIWRGIFFAATGSCALYAYKKNSEDSIVATIVMSVFSILLTLGVIAEMKIYLEDGKFEELPDGYKAAGTMLMIVGITAVVCSGACMVAASVYMCQCKCGNYKTEPVTGESLLMRLQLVTTPRDGNGDAVTTDLTTDPSPFSTMQEVVTLQWIGLWKIAVGVASITLGSILMTQNVHEDIRSGIWCGVAITLTGVLALAASWTHRSKEVHATMYMSILCLILVLVMIVNCTLFTITERVCSKRAACYKYVQGSTIATQNGLLIAIGLADIVMSFWCLTLCWKAVCCCCCCCFCCCCTQELQVERRPATGGNAGENVTRSLSVVRLKITTTRVVVNQRQAAIVGTTSLG